MEEKRNVGKAIFFAFIGCLIFGLVFILCRVLLILLFSLFSNSPVLSWLINRILNFRAESPNFFICLIASLAGVFVSMLVLEKISKSYLTISLSCKISGIALIVIHTIFLIVNLIHGSPVAPNITQIIAGVQFIYISK